MDELILNGAATPNLNGSVSPSINGSRGNAELILNGISQRDLAIELSLTSSAEIDAWNTKYSGSYTRPLAMSVDDFEDISREATANVAPFYGGRKVKNLCLQSQDLSSATWQKTLAGITSTTVFKATAQNGYIRQFIATVEGQTYRISAMFGVLNDGQTPNNRYYEFHTNSATGNETLVLLSRNSERYSFAFLGRAGDGNVAVGFQDQNTSLWADIYISGYIFENVTGQANQNPSDHIAATTGIATKYYNNENVNTVSLNVVRKRIIGNYPDGGSCLGDSQVNGVDSFSIMLNAVMDGTVTNEGVGGNTLAEMDTRFIADADPANKSFVLVGTGINSILSEETLANMQTSILSMKSKTETNGAEFMFLQPSPFGGYSGWTQAKQDLLEGLNTWLDTLGIKVFKAYNLLGDPTDQLNLNPYYTDDVELLHWNALAERLIYDELLDPYFRATTTATEVPLTNTIGLAFAPATPSDCHFTNTNLIKATKGSIYIEYEAQPDYATADGTVVFANGDCEIICEADTDGISFTDGTNTTVGSVGVPSGVTKAVIVWEGISVKITTANGTTTGTYAGNFGNARIDLGGDGTTQDYSGIISNIKFYYNRVLSDDAINRLVNTEPDVGDFYTSISGDDSTGVSWATAKNTISDGVLLPQAIDKTVVIDGGNYAEQLTLTWPVRNGIHLIGAKQYGHNSDVVITGQSIGIQGNADNYIIENLTVYAPANQPLRITSQNTTFTDVTLKRGSYKLYIADTDSSSVTTFNNCIFDNDGETTSLGITGIQAGDIIFNNCYFRELKENFANGSGTYTFNNCFIIMESTRFFRAITGTSEFIFNNCYFFAVKDIDLDYITNDSGGTVSITLNNCFTQLTPYWDKGVGATDVTLNSCQSHTLGLASRRRPVKVCLGVDDTPYFSAAQGLFAAANARGVVATWHVSTNELTEEMWTFLNTEVPKGHEVCSHGVAYGDNMGDLFAFYIEYTGAGTGTFEIANDTLLLKVDTVTVKTIDLTTDVVSDTIADIEATADFSATEYNSINHLDAASTLLADIAATDVGSETVVLLDEGYYSYVATESKRVLEENITDPDFVCEIMVWMRFNRCESAITALQDAGYIGAGGVVGPDDWLWNDQIDLYEMGRIGAEHFDFTTDETLKSSITSFIEPMGYYGGAAQIYAHSDGVNGVDETKWGRIIDILQELYVEITGYSDIVEYMRANATVTDNRTADFTFDDDDWLPQVLL